MPTGARIRANNVFGTTTDNPLLAAAVTFNSTELALLPEVSGDHSVITLDPLRQNGEPEIVVVTAHGPGATSATITRGQYGTVAREHPSGTIWAHAPLDEDMIEVLTSSTRPSDPFEGQVIYETDTDRYIARQAGAWVGLIPVGLIAPFGGTIAPTGWLLCDGSAVSRTIYADLFTLIAEDYGVGDGATTFNLPDLQDRVPVGLGATFPTIAATGGSPTSTANHTHNLATHTHTLSSHTHNSTNGPSSASTGGPSSASTGTDSPDHAHVLTGIPTSADSPDHTHGAATGTTNVNHTHKTDGSSPSEFASAPTPNAAFNNTATAGRNSTHGHTLIGNSGGRNVTHTHSMQSHTHSMQAHTHTTNGPSTNTSGISSPNTSDGSSVGAANGNMPPFQVVGSYIIKY